MPAWASRGALFAAILHAAWLVADFGGAETTHLFDNLAMGLSSLAAGLACLWAWRHLHGKAGRAWLFLGLGCLSWALGQATWSAYEHLLNELAPYPSWADAGYFGMIPLAAIGLLLLGGSNRTPLNVRDVLDGLIMGAALLLVLWPAVLAPTYNFTDMTPFAKTLSLAYPVGDVLLATMVMLRLRRTTGTARLAPALLATGLLALSAAHMVYAYLIVQGTYYTGHLIDIGWFSGFLLVALAGTAAPRAHEAVPRSATRRAGSLDVTLPYVPLLAAAIVTGTSQLEKGRIDAFAFWLSGAVVAVVAIRQLLALFDNAVLTRELGATVDRLRETQASRIRLIHGLAHDLRGPLTPIAIQIKLLRTAQPALPPAEAKRVEMVAQNSERLRAMMDDLRDVVRLEEGDLKLDIRRVDLAEQVKQVAETLADVAAERQLTIECDAPQRMHVLGDADRLQRVLHNLIGNAIKFTPVKGQIGARVLPLSGEAVVRITDSGPGLTEDQRGRLFNAFSQVHDSAMAEEKGTGLGLYISKGILEQHGGRIWCESDGPGKGTTFAFALPLAT